MEKSQVLPQVDLIVLQVMQVLWVVGYAAFFVVVQVKKKADVETSASRHLSSPSVMLLHFTSIITFTKTIMEAMQDMQNT